MPFISKMIGSNTRGFSILRNIQTFKTFLLGSINGGSNLVLNNPFYPQEEQMKKPKNKLKEFIQKNKFTFLFLSLKFMKTSKLPQLFASYPNYQHFIQDTVSHGLWDGILLSLPLPQNFLFDKFMFVDGKNILLILVNTPK